MTLCVSVNNKDHFVLLGFGWKMRYDDGRDRRVFSASKITPSFLVDGKKSEKPWRDLEQHGRQEASDLRKEGSHEHRLQQLTVDELQPPETLSPFSLSFSLAHDKSYLSRWFNFQLFFPIRCAYPRFVILVEKVENRYKIRLQMAGMM